MTIILPVWPVLPEQETTCNICAWLVTLFSPRLDPHIPQQNQEVLLLHLWDNEMWIQVINTSRQSKSGTVGFSSTILWKLEDKKYQFMYSCQHIKLHLSQNFDKLIGQIHVLTLGKSTIASFCLKSYILWPLFFSKKCTNLQYF